MDAQKFIDNFATIADAPGGVQRLRDLVLELAVRGQLVNQEAADEPAAVLLEGMSARRNSLIASGAIGKPRHPEGVAVDDPPHEIPASWAWARLGDVGAVVGGGTPKSGEPAYWADGPDVPWLTPADMRSQTSRLVSRGDRDITERGLAESSAQLLPAGSVLFSSRAPIGHVGIAAQPLATNQGFKSCVPYVGEMTEYLYLFLRYVGPFVDASATGTTFKEVSGKQVALIPLPVPPLAEQERIVAKVDELMGLCDELEARRERRRRATSRFRASALHALTRAETPGDRHDAWDRLSTHWPALTEHPDDIQAVRQTLLALGITGRLARPQDAENALVSHTSANHDAGPWRLPEGWTWSTLDDTCVLQTGVTPSKDEFPDCVDQVAYITPAQLGWLSVDEGTHVPAEAAGRTAPAGSVLFVGIGGSIGKCGLTTVVTTFNQQIHSATAHDDLLSPAYAVLAIASPWFQAQTRQRTSATAIPILNKSKWGSIPIPVPPRETQDTIVHLITRLFKACEDVENRIRAQRSSQEELLAPILEHVTHSRASTWTGS